MEIYELLIRVKKDNEMCIVLPKTLQKHEFYQGKTKTLVSFGQKKAEVPIRFHKGNELILSDKLAANLCFPYGKLQLHVIIQKHLIKIGPLLSVYVRKEKTGDFGLLNTFLKSFADLCIDKKIAFMVFTPNNTNYETKTIVGYRFCYVSNAWKICKFPLPDVIIDRGIFGGTKYWNSAHKERMMFQNNPDIIKFNASLGNKYETYEILAKNSMLSEYLPDTIVYNDFQDLVNMLDKYTTVYMKPVGGTQGYGIIKVSRQNNKYHIFINDVRYTSNTVKSMCLFINKKINQFNLHNKQLYIIQQAIPLFKVNNSILDFRVLLQKRENLRWGITAVVARVGKQNDITSNLSRGGTVIDGEAAVKQIAKKLNIEDANILYQKIKDVSILAAFTLENSSGSFGELGIDLGVDTSGNPWIIEINPRPGRKSLRLVDEAKRTQSLEIPIQYCLELWFRKFRGNLRDKAYRY